MTVRSTAESSIQSHLYDGTSTTVGARYLLACQARRQRRVMAGGMGMSWQPGGSCWRWPDCRSGTGANGTFWMLTIDRTSLSASAVAWSILTASRWQYRIQCHESLAMYRMYEHWRVSTCKAVGFRPRTTNCCYLCPGHNCAAVSQGQVLLQSSARANGWKSLLRYNCHGTVWLQRVSSIHHKGIGDLVALIHVPSL